MKDNILIGTSGYDSPEWKGVFYPPEVKRADFLSYYATQFNAVELNSEVELKEFVPVVHVASEEGKKVQVYINNHPKENASRNAITLKEMVNNDVKI